MQQNKEKYKRIIGIKGMKGIKTVISQKQCEQKKRLRD